MPTKYGLSSRPVDSVITASICPMAAITSANRAAGCRRPAAVRSRPNTPAMTAAQPRRSHGKCAGAAISPPASSAPKTTISGSASQQLVCATWWLSARDSAR